MTSGELQANQEGRFHGTTGIVFAFDSALSLDTVLEHAKDLNETFDSHLWPEMIVVLDKGLITYMIQYPGGHGFAGSLMSVAYPPGWGPKGGPPWYVHLAVHRDGEFTLNRFFVSLLSHLHFFPYVSGVPPFKVMLEGASDKVMTLTGYQFDLAGQLRPVPERDYITEDHTPTVQRGIDVYVANRDLGLRCFSSCHGRTAP